jgi:hypothetical protein
LRGHASAFRPRATETMWRRPGCTDEATPNTARPAKDRPPRRAKRSIFSFRSRPMNLHKYRGWSIIRPGVCRTRRRGVGTLGTLSPARLCCVPSGDQIEAGTRHRLLEDDRFGIGNGARIEIRIHQHAPDFAHLLGGNTAASRRWRSNECFLSSSFTSID